MFCYEARTTINATGLTGSIFPSVLNKVTKNDFFLQIVRGKFKKLFEAPVSSGNLGAQDARRDSDHARARALGAPILALSSPAPSAGLDSSSASWSSSLVAVAVCVAMYSDATGVL